MAKTRDEIEALKEGWKRDPIWDIEDTEGFEQHREELLAWRRDWEDEVNKRVAANAKKRIEQMKKETGITDSMTAMYLRTFAELQINIQNARRGDISEAMVSLAEASASATLLLAAQVKRVADELQNANDYRDAEDERREVRDLYRGAS